MSRTTGSLGFYIGIYVWTSIFLSQHGPPRHLVNQLQYNPVCGQVGGLDTESVQLSPLAVRLSVVSSRPIRSETIGTVVLHPDYPRGALDE